jgi:hypothetical protein
MSQPTCHGVDDNNGNAKFGSISASGLQPKHPLFRLRIYMALLCPLAEMWNHNFTGYRTFSSEVFPIHYLPIIR